MFRGIGRRAVRKVLGFFRRCCRPVWNFTSFDNSQAGRYTERARMILNVPGGGIQYLPHAVQVGFTAQSF
ncbi:MAG: hypothetical protein DMG11_20800 [Acidobacteria bacterium]|nr:MAG: hypothetical protein DMG11_20800 [Acidobacteriota bacterium]